MLLSITNGTLSLDHAGPNYFVNSTGGQIPFKNSSFEGETFTGTLNSVNYTIKFAANYSSIESAVAKYSGNMSDNFSVELKRPRVFHAQGSPVKFKVAAKKCSAFRDERNQG